jgi:transposase-like protein
MVDKITKVLQEYQEKVSVMPFIPKCSFQRDLLGASGDMNKIFLTFLFCDYAMGLQFLKDVGIIRSNVQCNSGGHTLSWQPDASVSDGFRRCRRMVGGVRCSVSKSIRHPPWFQNSHLTFQEILFLTYDILCREPAHQIKHEHRFGDHVIPDWGMYCLEAMSVFLEGCSEKIDGPNRTVEIDESKFGQRKYHRGHSVRGQWVFGGIERESGRTFLVPVPDRTAPTLVKYIRKWITPGTTNISDCWAAYRDVGSIGYSHRTVNHSVSFVNPETGNHTNTVESTWRAVKQFLRPYNKRDDYDLHLAHYMFMARCKAMGIPQFNQFLAIVASNNWANCSPPTN